MRARKQCWHPLADRFASATVTWRNAGPPLEDFFLAAATESSSQAWLHSREPDQQTGVHAPYRLRVVVLPTEAAVVAVRVCQTVDLVGPGALLTLPRRLLAFWPPSSSPTSLHPGHGRVAQPVAAPQRAGRG